MPSDHETAGKTERELDDAWYEAYADKVHYFGKQWPDPLTDAEEKACAAHADSIVRRPAEERYDQNQDDA
jgi:hypothetical protein